MNLTPDERTVLLIAAKGAPMMPIGRWKVPTLALVEKGFMKPHKHAGDPTGYFNHYITPAGQLAAEELDRDDDQALADMINHSRGLAKAQHKAAASAEQIAVQLVDLAELSSKATGDSKTEALRNWARIILERALEMMNRGS